MLDLQHKLSGVAIITKKALKQNRKAKMNENARTTLQDEHPDHPISKGPVTTTGVLHHPPQ